MSIFIIQGLIQQIAQSVINNHLLLMSLLHVLTSARPSSGRYIQMYTSTATSVEDVCVYLNAKLSIKIAKGFRI
jgi:hypothetical protein